MSLSRYTTVSSQRFASISLTSAAELRLSLRGAAGEEVVVTALKVKRGTPTQGDGGGLPRSYQVVVQSVKIGPHGSAEMTFSPRTP